MFNLTLQEAKQLRRLLANEDFLIYQRLLRNLKESEEQKLWSKSDSLELTLERRNTLDLIINAPKKAVDEVEERETVKQISATDTYDL